MGNVNVVLKRSLADTLFNVYADALDTGNDPVTITLSRVDATAFRDALNAALGTGSPATGLTVTMVLDNTLATQLQQLYNQALSGSADPVSVQMSKADAQTVFQALTQALSQGGGKKKKKGGKGKGGKSGNSGATGPTLGQA